MGFGPTEFLIVTGPVQVAVTFGRIIHTRHRRTVYWHGMVYLFTLLGFEPSTPGFICFTLPGFEHSAPGWILFHPTGIRTLNPWVYFVHPTGIWTLNHWDYYVPTFEHSTTGFICFNLPRFEPSTPVFFSSPYQDFLMTRISGFHSFLAVGKYFSDNCRRIRASKL